MNLILQMAMRFLVLCAGMFVALFFVLAAAVPYGGAGGQLEIWVTVVLFLMAWTVLPAFRASVVAGAVLTMAWAWFGFWLRGTADNGWPLGPFAVASVMACVCLMMTPPSYLRGDKLAKEGEPQ